MTIYTKSLDNTWKTGSRKGRSKVTLLGINGGRLYLKNSAGEESSISLLDIRTFGGLRKTGSIINIWFNLIFAAVIALTIPFLYKNEQWLYLGGIISIISIFLFSCYKSYISLSVGGFSYRGDKFYFDSNREKRMLETQVEYKSSIQQPNIDNQIRVIEL